MKFQADISMPHTHTQTYIHTDKPKPICPRLFKSWGHKKWSHQIFKCSRAANSIVSSGIWPEFKLNQAFMHVLLTCQNEDPIKNEDVRVATTLNIEFSDA